MTLVSWRAGVNIPDVRAGESNVLRPSCCGVTPWLIILSNSSPESLLVWPVAECIATTKTSRGFRRNAPPPRALVNASGPQIEVRRCLSCVFYSSRNRNYAASTAAVFIWHLSTDGTTRCAIFAAAARSLRGSWIHEIDFRIFSNISDHRGRAFCSCWIVGTGHRSISSTAGHRPDVARSHDGLAIQRCRYTKTNPIRRVAASSGD